jgi:hypothetical protein
MANPDITKILEKFEVIKTAVDEYLASHIANYDHEKTGFIQDQDDNALISNTNVAKAAKHRKNICTAFTIREIAKYFSTPTHQQNCNDLIAGLYRIKLLAESSYNRSPLRHFWCAQSDLGKAVSGIYDDFIKKLFENAGCKANKIVVNPQVSQFFINTETEHLCQQKRYEGKKSVDLGEHQSRRQTELSERNDYFQASTSTHHNPESPFRKT